MTQTAMPEDAPHLDKVFATPRVQLTRHITKPPSGTPREILAKMPQNTTPEHVHIQRLQPHVPGLLHPLSLRPPRHHHHLHNPGRKARLDRLDIPLPTPKWRLQNVAWH